MYPARRNKNATAPGELHQGDASSCETFRFFSDLWKTPRGRSKWHIGQTKIVVTLQANIQERTRMRARGGRHESCSWSVR